MFDASARTNLARSPLSLPHHGVKRGASVYRVHDHTDGTSRKEQKAQRVVNQEHDTASSARLRGLEQQIEIERVRLKREEFDETDCFRGVVKQFALETKDSPLGIDD